MYVIYIMDDAKVLIVLKHLPINLLCIIRIIGNLQEKAVQRIIYGRMSTLQRQLRRNGF